MTMCADKDIEALEALRAECVAKRDEYMRLCEVPWVQADGGGLFPDADFTSQEYLAGMAECLDKQIQRIDIKLSRMRKEENNNETQTEIDFDL